MEAYAGTITRAKHTIYLDGTAVEADGVVDLTIYDVNGEPIPVDDSEGAPVIRQATLDNTGEEPFYYVSLGQDITSDYEAKTMRWSYAVDGNSVVTPPEHLIVVNPYVTYSQFKQMYPDTNLAYWEFALVEPVVRKVIETYANQTFTREDGVSYVITGQNRDSLPLSKQIIELESVEVMDPHVDSAGNERPYDITQYLVLDPDDRWSLRRRTGSHVQRSMSPTHQRSMFKYPMRYRVTGSFGWDMVPEDVTRAAAILVNDYACADAKYREKYIANIRAGDWRMEFIATGDETTGNANADMILSRFRNVGLAVI